MAKKDSMSIMNEFKNAPKQICTDFFLDLQGFSGLLSPKTMLSGALVSTVSTQSEAVDGQNCGQLQTSHKSLPQNQSIVTHELISLTRTLYHKTSKMSRIHIRGFCNTEQHLRHQELSHSRRKKRLRRAACFPR